MNLFKAIRARDFRSLQKGDYTPTYVNVFCGYNRYKDNVTAVNEIAQAVATTFPHIEPENMTVWHIQPHESDRHARMMTVMVNIPTDEVLRNLTEYTIL